MVEIRASSKAYKGKQLWQFILRTQRFNSWRVRTAEGLDDNASEDDIAEARQSLEQDDILTGTGDMKFGTLEATDLQGFIASHESDLESLAATSQTRTAAMTPAWPPSKGC